MTDSLHLDISDHIAVVRLNRPDRMNAVDLDMFQAFIDVAQQLRAASGVRAVVLHGTGKNFCSGIDLAALQAAGTDLAGSGRMEPQAGSPANFFQAAGFVWREIPVPVIAAIEGVAFGAGLQIALGADIRHARADAKLSIMEIKWGIIPDLAMSVTARDVVPLDRLKELAFSGRVISGSDALAHGLVTAIHDDPLASATALATEICARNPEAIRAIKQLFDKSWNPDVFGSLRREAMLQMSLLGTPNQAEAVLANLQKRTPVFGDAES